MSRLTFLHLLLFSLLAGVILEGRAAGPKTPNIVLVLVDDLGRQDLGCYGNTFIDTPNIDRLASQGMRFTQAYSSCPVCSPTRAALLTGKSPARVHFTGHITSTGRHRYPENSRILPPNDLLYIPLEEVTIAEALKPAGYTSVSIGKWHVGHEGFFPTDQGFDFNIAGWTAGSPPTHFYPYTSDKDWNPSIPTLKGGKPGEYLTDRLTDEAIRFIEANQQRSFFVYLPYYAVHTPLEAPQDLVEKYKQRAESKIDPIYAAMVDSVDANVGRLLGVLDRLSLASGTIVIVGSDNGAVASTSDNRPFRAGKGHLYEGGIRVPLLVRWPGQVEPGSVSSVPTISEDLYSTLVEIVDGALPGAPLDGRSLLPNLTGREKTEPTELHWYYPHYSPQANQPGAAIRVGEMKLIEFYDPAQVELYDLAVDIGETKNLAAERPEQTQTLLGKLHAWLDGVDAIRHEVREEKK